MSNNLILHVNSDVAVAVYALCGSARSVAIVWVHGAVAHDVI